MVARALQAQPLGKSPWSRANWLILAPHADDEVLGCGALISDAAHRDCLAGIAFLTDGAGSHPCRTATQRIKLAAVRRSEARAAIRLLSPAAPAPLFLGWPDAAPHDPASDAFAATATRMAQFCNRTGVDAIAVTGRDEPHCDHVAAFDLARAVVRLTSRPTRVFEYVVWAQSPPGPEFIIVKTAAINVGRRKAALAQHRSQMTPLFGDGFQVPLKMRDMPARDLLYTRRRM